MSKLIDNIMNTLGLDPIEFEQWKTKPETFRLHQLRRKIRYKCFAMGRGNVDIVPEKFIKYYENQPHFSGWDLFADRWDVAKKDPLKTYPRKFSVAQEWEATLSMAVPELPGAIAYKQSE
jgi:hypothetical protein